MKAIFRLSALAVAWTALSSLCIGPRAEAAEPAQAFVDGLRQRGYYDYALEYLNRASSDPFVSDEFKRKILYEEGLTLLEQATRVLDAGRQAAKFNSAQEKLQAFIEAQPQSALAPGARSQLAKVLMARGRGLVRQTEKLDPAQSEQRDQLLAEARQRFGDARAVFEASQSHYVAALEKRNKESNNSASGATAPGKGAMATDGQIALLRRNLVQSQLWIAEAMYERARTQPVDSGDFQTELAAAAERYKGLYETHKNSLAGLHARLWQGRCYQDMGQLDAAIECYEDLIRREANLPVLRILVSKAYRQQAECYLELAQYDEVILKCEAWLAQARGAESRLPDWLAVQYQLALAHAEKGRSLRKGSTAAKMHIRAARELARQTGQWKSEYQQPAKFLFAELGPGAMTTRPTTFDEAYDAAITAIDLMRSSEAVLKMARRNNPTKVAEIQEQFAESRDVAFEYFRASLAMADAKTDRDKINRARFYLSYLNYNAGRYYDAAVLSEFLLRNYPKNDYARDAAKIAIEAYRQLYYRSADDDRAFESAKIAEIADFITTHWPDQKEGDDAYLILVSVAIRQGDIDRAEQYLARMSPQRRAAAQVQIGTAYWSAYLRQQRSDPAVRPSEAALEELKAKALTELEQGIGNMRGQQVTAATANAALSLAQIYLEASQFKAAVALLEDPQIGPLALLASNSPVVDRVDYADATYKAALRAFVSVSPPEREKAIQAMDALEALAAQADDPQAAEKLTQVLMGLGGRLQRVIEDLNRQGRAPEAANVAEAFEDFLERVSSRSKGGTWSSRNWIAQTYYNLAAGLDDGRALTQQTRTYYAKAIAAYEAILEASARDTSFPPSTGALLSVKIRLAECLRRSRRHADAIELIAGILAEKPNMLEAQVIAARTYQAGGDSGEPRWYDFAIKGGHKDAETGKNVIWGWGKLSRIASRYPKYRNTFFEARYNMNLCRLQSAMKQSDERRAAYLRSARDDLIVMNLLYSDDGWIEWRPKFERLLKDVQRNMKVPENGFQNDDKSSVSQATAEGAAVKN